MCMFDIEPITPNTLNNHSITMMTTTTFKIFLIFLSMGMYELISHSTTPTTMRMISKEISDIIAPPLFQKGEISRSIDIRRNYKAIAIFGSNGAALSMGSGAILVCGKLILNSGNCFASFPHVLLKSHDFGFTEDKITKTKIGCYE